MITLYIWDAAGIYSHSVERDPKSALPVRSTMTAPPELNEGEYARWIGGAWAIVTEIPLVPAVVPEKVTMRQARLALHSVGILAQVQPAIDALPEPDRTAAQIEWDYSSEVSRNREFVNMLGGQLGLTGEQIDQLFIQAATL